VNDSPSERNNLPHSIDVKRSTHRKLATFLSSLQSRNLVTLAAAKGVIKISRIHRGHSDYKDFEAVDLMETEGGAALAEREAASSGVAVLRGVLPIEVQEVVRPHAAMVPHLFTAEERDVSSKGQGGLQRGDCKERLDEYIKRWA
jgi:hypothetical protein